MVPRGSWEVMVGEEQLLEERHVLDRKIAAVVCLAHEVEGLVLGLLQEFLEVELEPFAP